MAMERTWRWFGAKDKIDLSQLKQFGVEGVVTALHHIKNGEVWPEDEIAAVKDKIGQHGMRWSVVESLPVCEEIKIRGPRCDEFIDNYIRSMNNLAACGIDTICYNFMPVLDWARTDLHFRDERGAESMLFDYKTFAAFDAFILRRPGAERDYSEELIRAAREVYDRLSEQERDVLAYNIIVVTQGFINGTVGNVKNYRELFLSFLETYREIDAVKLRENLLYFLKSISPAAEQAGIKMCIHPDDPPFPLLGLPRIASTKADFEYIFRECPSPSNGLTFCTGSLGVNEENDLGDIIRSFAERIHFVHLRNVNILPGDGRSFYESAHLEGRVDMYEVISLLLQEQKRRVSTGSAGALMPFRPDHGLRILDDFGREANPGYPLIGRMRGLVEVHAMQTAIERSIK